MIQTINERFVSTTITYYDVLEIRKKGDAFAHEVVANWSNPVSLMFFSPEGRYITKLTLLKELITIHPDTTYRPGQTIDPSPEHNMRALLKHIDMHFGKAS